MAHEIDWLVEGRVIHQRFYGVVTVQELVDASHCVRQFINQGTPPIHGIIDTVAVKEHPSGVREIRRALRHLRYDAGRGWVVVIATDPFVRYLASVVIQMIGLRFRVFDTLDEAFAFLASHDATLRNLSAAHLAPSI